MTGGLRVLSAPSGRDSDKVCLTLDGAAATASRGVPESRTTNPRMKMKNILIMSHPQRCGERKMRSEERVIPWMCLLRDQRASQIVVRDTNGNAVSDVRAVCMHKRKTQGDPIVFVICIASQDISGRGFGATLRRLLQVMPGQQDIVRAL